MAFSIIVLLVHLSVIQVTLGLSLGVKGVVKKHRMLYMVGQTRVHVDQVEGLGDFMELEVIPGGGNGGLYGSVSRRVVLRTRGKARLRGGGGFHGTKGNVEWKDLGILLN